MTDIRITNLMTAGDILLRTLDPEGMLSKGKVVRITHRLSDDRKGFSWRADVAFGNNDALKMYGQFHEEMGMFVTRCSFLSEGVDTDIEVNTSETLFSAIADLSRLPARLKDNLARIGLKTTELGAGEDQYGMASLRSMMNVLFWEVDGGEPHDPERSRFTEFSIFMRKDEYGHFNRSNIVGTCVSGVALIRVRVTADMYGLSSRTVTLERSMGGKDEISSYCYTEDFTGRKIPSLKLAFRLERMLSGKDDVQQRVERKGLNKPVRKKSSAPSAEVPVRKPKSDNTMKEVIEEMETMLHHHLHPLPTRPPWR